MSDSNYLTFVSGVKLPELRGLRRLDSIEEMGRPITRTTLAQRLVVAMAEAQLSQHKLEQLAGLGRGGVNKLVKGVRGGKMSADVLFKLADELRVRPEWLYREQGAMREGPEQVIADAAPAREVAKTVALLSDISDEAVEITLLEHGNPRNETRHPLWWLKKMEQTEKRLWLRREQEKRVREREGRRKPEDDAHAPLEEGKVPSEGKPRRKRAG